MFESLGEKFDGLWRKLQGQGRITERNIEEALRDVRLALLEADVNVGVVARLRRGDPQGRARPGGAAQPHARAALHQARAPRARPAAGREAGLVRSGRTLAGRHHAGRPERRRQDDDDRQARSLAARRARPAPVPGPRRRLPSGRHRAARAPSRAQLDVPVHAASAGADPVAHRARRGGGRRARRAPTRCSSTPPAVRRSTKS